MLGMSFISVLAIVGKGTSRPRASLLSILQQCKYNILLMSNIGNYYSLFLMKLSRFNYCFFILELTFGMMDLLEFSTISFGSGVDMKRLSDDLNEWAFGTPPRFEIQRGCGL
jgi:hypothetical protein